jgi:hypothetical protein
MNRFFSITFYAVCLAIALAVDPSAALADDGPDHPLFELMSLTQVEQDVEITIGFPKEVFPSPYDTLTLVREHEDGDHVVFEDKVFTVDDMEGESGAHYLYTAIDECVPPADYDYDLDGLGWGGWDHTSFSVEESGIDCVESADGTPGSNESGDPADEDADGGSCSVSGVGSGAGTGLLVFVIMGLLGLCAFALRRNES